MRISDWSSDVCSSDLPAADRVPLARCRDRAVGAKRLAQDRQLLIHRPTATTANERDPTAHTITHMTGHKSTRSSRSDILAHHRARKRGVSGKSLSVLVDLCGCSIIKKQTYTCTTTTQQLLTEDH